MGSFSHPPEVVEGGNSLPERKKDTRVGVFSFLASQTKKDISIALQTAKHFLFFEKMLGNSMFLF